MDSIRLFWSDVLRVVSIFAVVLLHVAAYVVVGIRDTSQFYWWVGNIVDASVRWCVPTLIMISGAFLLDRYKDESIYTFYKKRVARIFFPIIFWTVFSFIFLSLNNKVTFKLVWFKFLIGAPYPHLWYLYMILGLYLITPFLRTYVKFSSSGERTYLICFIFLLAIAVTILKFFVYKGFATIFTIFVPYTGYYLLGYQLRLFDTKRIPYSVLIATVLFCSVMIICFTGYVANKYGLSIGVYFYDYFSPFVIVMSGAVFIIVKKSYCIETKKVHLMRSWVQKIVPTTLGIYIIHYFILDALWIFFRLSPASFNPLLSIPIFTVFIFIVSFVLVLIISRIPYLKLIV